MPLIMDDRLDIDDLFGDAAALQLPPTPPAKGLLQRVEESRLSGCCQKVAWSKLGCIAYITHDGQGVDVRNLLCRAGDGKWAMSGDNPVDQVSSVHEQQHLVHLSWNHTGSELAVVDIFGRISIFSILIAMNRFAISRSCVLDQEDDMGAIVGLSWLNIDRPSPLYRPAVRHEGQWNYSASSHKPMGPFHPANKSALVAVTRGGLIRLVYQQPDGRWLEASAEIESISSSVDLLTHASLCADKDNSLLLMVHTVSCQLRLYRVQINWNIPSNPKQIPPTQFSPIPTLQIRHVKLEHHCAPIRSLNDSDGAITGAGSRDPSQAYLSHLELVPMAPESKHRNPTYPTIVAIFSCVHNDNNSSQQFQEPFSIISRWELRSTNQSLHSSFGQLAFKRTNGSLVTESTQIPDLVRLEDIVTDGVVISVHQMNLSTVISLAFSNGAIEFRDRVSMKLIESDDNFVKVSSMQQIGFSFSNDEPCLHMATSPNSCLAVALASDGKARLKTMQYRSGTLATSTDDPSFAATVVAFALQFAYSCTNLSNNDDILAVIQQCSALTLEHEILNEIYRVLGVNVDYSGDPQQEKLFRNPMIRGCLSMQASFGFRGAQEHQSLIAKIASTTLNLRLASLTFTFMFNNVSRPSAGFGAESDFTKPVKQALADVFQSLLGIVTWSVDLMNFIIDELYGLAEVVKGRWGDKDFIKQKIHALNSPALPLVMISASRTFLKYNCRGLRGLGTTAHRNFQAHAQGENLQSFKSLEDVIERSPIEVHQFEKILADIEGKIKKTYQHSGMSEADRARVEKEMLISADIPEVLMPVVHHLLTTALDNLRNDIDPAALYFADHSWLGLSDDRRSDAYKRDHVVDAIRKIPLRKGAKLRRCTRCCAYMEDVLPQKGSSMWMTSMQRMCFCGSLWMLIGENDKPDAK